MTITDGGATFASSAPIPIPSPPPKLPPDPNRWERENIGEAAATEPAVSVDEVEEDPEDADDELEDIESWVS